MIQCFCLLKFIYSYCFLLNLWFLIYSFSPNRDTRYVLLMTENYAALRVLEKRFPEENAAASVIFGSSFPKDQEFTQV